MNQEQDNELMLAYAGGHADAFESLYARHKRALYQFMLNSCGNEALAHELYQDVWLRVVNSRDSYTSDSPFNAWLYRIARNRLIDHYRQNAKTDSDLMYMDEEHSPIATIASQPLPPDEIASLTQRADVLTAALQKLPPAQREVMLLRHIAGMSIKEVAEFVEEGAETVKSRLRYAVTKIRSQLQELA